MVRSEFIVLNQKNSTCKITYEDLETIPHQFFHDHTWFEPKISEIKILKFHD